MNNIFIDNRHIRVFISSTFQDMKDEREYLIKRIFPELKQIAEKRDVSLTFMDLRWGITEEEVNNGKVVEICLREIENSIPFFIGIVGNRYGWCPTSKDLEDEILENNGKIKDYLNRHLSITEMEIQFGVLEREENMHAYFYINKNEIDENEIDYPEKLRTLKSSIRNNKRKDGFRYPVFEYETKEDLGNDVKSSFISLINSIFPDESLTQLDKEYIAQKAHKNQLSKTYSLSQKYVDDLNLWLHNKDEKSLIVTGISRTGKSTLLSYFITLLEKESQTYDVIYNFVEHGVSQFDFFILQDYLSHVIYNKYKGLFHIEEPEDLNTVLHKLQEHSINILIILDGINYLPNSEQSKILNWIHNDKSSTKFIISTIDDYTSSRLFTEDRFSLIKVFPLSNNKKKIFISQYLNNYGKNLNNNQIAKLSDFELCKNPHILKTLLDDLILFGSHDNINDKISEYVSCSNLDDFYDVWIKNIEHEFTKETTKLIMSIIFVSRNGLNENDLMDICDVSPLVLSQLLNLLRQQILCQNGLMKFNNSAISDYIENIYADEKYLIHVRNVIIQNYIDIQSDFAYQEVSYQLYKLAEVQKLYDFIKNSHVALAILNNDKFSFVKYWKALVSSNFSISIYLSCGNTPLLSKIGSLLVPYFNDPHCAELFYETYSSRLNSTAQMFDNIIQNLCDKVGDIAYGTTELINPGELMMKGDVAFNKGNYEDAILNYSEALKFDEELEYESIIDLYERIGSSYDELGQYEDAISYYEKSLTVYNQNNLSIPDLYVKILVSYAISLVHIKPRNAVEILEDAYKLASESFLDNSYTIQILMNLGTFYCDYFSNNYKASYYFMKAIKLIESSNNEDDTLLAKLYVNLASVTDNEERQIDFYAKSMELFSKHDLYSELPNLLYKSGLYYEKKKDYFVALSRYTRSYSIAEKLNFEDYCESIYEDIARVCNIVTSLGYEQYLDTNLDETIMDYSLKKKMYETIAKSGCPIANFELSGLYAAKQRGDNIISLKRLKASAIGGLPQGLFQYGLYFLRNDNIAEAIKWLELALEQNYIPAAYLLGAIFDEKLNIEKAIFYYNIAAESYYEPSFNGLAYILHSINEDKKALKWAKLAVDSYPEDYNVRDTLGHIYKALGRYNESLLEFQKCLELQILDDIDTEETKKNICKLEILIDNEN